MRGRRKSVREGRVLLVVPDSEELARVATGLRSAGWRVSALSRFEAAPPAYSSTAPVIQRLATLSRGTLPIWVACACPAAYSGDETPNRAPVVGVLPTPRSSLAQPRQRDWRKCGRDCWPASTQPSFSLKAIGSPRPCRWEVTAFRTCWDRRRHCLGPLAATLALRRVELRTL